MGLCAESCAVKTLPPLFLRELGEILDFENQSSLNFAKWQQASPCRSLSRVLSVQSSGTATSAKRIELVFEAFNRTASPIPCNALAELIDPPHPFESSPPSAESLFCTLARIEQYRMATYGCLCDWAAFLGNDIATMHLHEGVLDARALHGSLARIARLEAGRTPAQLR
jgi:ferritin-like metal-binding protein YciE